MLSRSSPRGSRCLAGVLTLTLAVPTFLIAASINITAPSSKATVAGIFKFSVDTSAAPTVDRVEYRLGSLSLGFATTPPFNLTWNSGLASDGNYALDAIAYDAKGAVIATAGQVFDIQNRGGSITVDGQDLSAPLRGRIKLSVTAFDPLYYPARWSVFIDGVLQTTFFSDNAGKNKFTAELPLDTTHVSNGKHELHVEISTNLWPAGQQEKKTNHDARLALHRVIVTDNGHLPKAIAANFQNVYLKPDESTVLRCFATYTDDRSAPCTSPSYTSSNLSAAAVDSFGKITAQGVEGFSNIAIMSGGEKTQVFVWVKKNLNIPHFSGDGRPLASYQPGTSIFPVAPFSLEVADVQDPSIDQEVKRAGVNTLYGGFYLNPRNLQAGIAQWESNYDGTVAPRWTWAAQHGYHLYAMGDEITRAVGGEGWWTLNWPPAKEAVQHAMQALASSGVAIAADIIDEGSMMWGANPTPPRFVGQPGMFTSIACDGARCTVTWPGNPVNPGRFFAGIQFALAGSRQANLNTPLGRMFTATNISDHSFDFIPAGPVQGTFAAANDPELEFLWWAGAAGCPSSPCNPPVPNTALLTVAGWLRSAHPHVLIAWPALGLSPPEVQDVWSGKDSKVSDFMSHYWDSLQAGHTYRWSNGVAERSYWMRDAFYRRQPFVDASKPQIMLDSICSYYYRKLAPGANFNPLKDELVLAGTSAAAISSGMMTAAAIGNAGVRLFQYERTTAQDGRLRMPLGGEALVGAGPGTTQEDSRKLWRAMAYSANMLTKRLEPFILGKALSSEALNENIVTAVRQSDQGILLMAVNGNDWERRVTLDLAPYRNGNPVTRYVVSGTGITTTVISDNSSNAVDLQPGAAAIYLVPASASVKFLSESAISAPSLPSGASKAFVHQAYIYAEDLDASTQGLECTNGCDLALDRNLGDSYYQFSFTNAAGVVVGRGPARLLRGLR
jgi:Bacterial Ig domain